MSTRQSKFLQWINYRIRVTLFDSRILIGTFLAFDKHMNLVLSDTEEYSRIKTKNKINDKERKRLLGLVLIRGDNVISLSAESPIPENNNKRFIVDNKTTTYNAIPINRVIKTNNDNDKNTQDINEINTLTTSGKGFGIPKITNFQNTNNMAIPPKIENKDINIINTNSNNNNNIINNNIKPPAGPAPSKNKK